MTDKLIATVVPRTISKPGQDIKVAATLVLRPGTTNDTDTSDNSLLFETWPTIIHRLFAAHDAVKAELSVTDSAGKKRSTKDGQVKPVFSTRLTTYPDISKDSGFAGLKFANITAIWRDLLKDRADHDGGMAGFRTALKDTAADVDHPYQDVQQGDDAPHKDAPNIVGMPRTELAQQITMARAQALIDRVCGRVPSRKAFLGEGAYFKRPWARAATATERLALDSIIRESRTRDVAGFTPDGTPVVFAADAPLPAARAQLDFDPHRYWEDYKKRHPDAPTPDVDQWAKIKDFLIEQRQHKDACYKDTLAEQQKSAGVVHEAERGLTGSKPGDSLQAIRDERAKHKTLQQAISDVNDNNGNIASKYLRLHDAATLEDYGKVPDSNSHTANDSQNESDQMADDARRRWFALLGFPALQHLFLLSVDIEFSFPCDKFEDLVRAAPKTPDFVRHKEPVSFLLIRLHVADNEPVLANIKFCGHWTLAKTPRSCPEQPESFMPATLEELLECFSTENPPTSAQSLRERGTIDQFDGVVDLEAAAISGDDSSLRFSIETVDIHAATESDMRRDTAMANAADLSSTNGTPLPLIPEVATAAAVERKLRTAGLQLLDQWRGSVVIKQFSRSLSVATESADSLILDADDLAVGYRLDVGFRTSATSTKLTWACLNNREVKYSLPGSALALDKAVEAMLAGPDVDVRKRRVELDGSVLAMPTRLLQNADGNKTGFAESVLAAWQGDPLGLEAYEQRVGVCPGGLALNVDFDLPSGSNDERPPKLRFGVPYWLGARTVFLGGVSLPLTDKKTQLTAQDLYEAGLSGGMLLPRHNQLRRFLRHEWIDPPMVAVPWADIVSELGIATKGAAEAPTTPVAAKPTKAVAGKPTEQLPAKPAEPVAAKPADEFSRGLDGETMVVRLPTPKPSTEEPDDAWRFKPLTSQRAVCAPGVDFTFAHLHGVFDADADPTKKFGLAGVDYDPTRGGFPSISPQATIEENSIVFMRTGINQPAASGIAIFRPRKQRSEKAPRAEELYYPDPAARSLVIGLRYHWTTDTYLAGTPIVVPLYGGGTSGFPGRDYPDAMPVLITVEAVAAGADGRLTKYEQLEKRAGGKAIRLVPIDKSKPPTGPNAAIEVIIKLAPAEDFYVDVWALPDVNRLAQWFDAPESVAFCCTATECEEKPDPASEKQKLSKAMPGKTAAKAYPSPAQTIRRNDAVVSTEAVAHAASRLHAALCLKPIPELSAVRSLRAVHAVERPPVAPKLLGSPLPEVRFVRVDETKRSEIVTQPVEDWHSWLRTCDSASATDVLAGGDISIDRAVHESVELRVQAVAPNGRPIDNPLLGRTPEDRSRGLWPKQPDRRTFARQDTSFTRRLYGFDVDDQGRVTFCPENIVFNKWLLQPDCHLAQETVSLVQLTAESEQPAPSASQQQDAAPTQLPNPAPADGQTAQKNAGNGRRSAQRYFSDGTARRLKTYFAATSRTARLIPDRSTYPDLAQQDRDKERLFACERDVHGKPVMTSAIIRSVVRPLALPPKHILPAFVWTNQSDAATGVRSISRRTRIRIPFDRPAMTSGEDERIGIVVWPPNILGASIKPGTASGSLPVWTETDLTVGKIRRAEPMKADEQQKNKLLDLQALGQQIESETKETSWRPGYFSDEDLGPGGAYISRWGADPIHDAGEVTWLIHPRAFRDVLDWSETALDSITAESKDSGLLWPEEKRYTPRLVENVLMPIPGDDPSKPNSESGSGQKDENPKEPDFMLVSLLTYAPRFDVESETWYIDVEIDPGTAPDPFLRLGLVRYQPHANRRIQVSYPVSEWIQVVGYCREVTLEREGETVTVAVKGPVLAKNISEAPLTTIRASLIERRVSEYGIAYERPARTLIDGKLGEPIEQVSYANAPSDELIWTGAFDLPNKDDSDDTVSYAIFIEECYRMRRATFDQEPVMEEPPPTERDDPAYWRDSGPRFAVRIDL